ncbi:prolyl oligopeptidase family serine peptidase [Sphingosinicella sp. CPCC 101087]|uniref:S9 family peptidase n=1 Tax=Sphingosinicella sp. CPCC 101087 TaxID=2497754 RepID=UPI00101D1F55|nr:prolyl oligopeptidase family serine peptidase [Sphingosinicella sp. CPCC 101087]
MRLSLLLLWLAALVCFSLIPGRAHAQGGEGGPFGVDHYFRLKRVAEIALAPDGQWLAFITESLAPPEAGGGRRVHLLRLDDGSVPVEVPALAGARRIAWVPGSTRLAFLRANGGRTKLHSYDRGDGTIRLERTSEDPITSFAFAPDGRTLAFVTRAMAEPHEALYDRFRNGTSGILVDPATTSSHDFLNPHWNALVRPPPPQLWVAPGGGNPFLVPVPGTPGGAFSWSSDSRRLSLTFVGSEMPSTQLGDDRTSLGLFDVSRRMFVTLLTAKAPRADKPGLTYSGGEWIPGEDRLLVRRVRESDPWVSGSYPDWALVDVSGSETAVWHPGEFYPSDLRFLPRSASDILVANTVGGVHSLFRLRPEGLSRSAFVAGLEGSSSGFSFSGDFRRVAFVHESLTRPPEVYVAGEGFAPRAVTRLNADVARAVDYGAREVRWTAADGVEIAGWLLTPAVGEGPWPLVTHVHGGPAFPYPDAFAPYFDHWPYPFEVYAGRGYAVFFPNYRGTHSYGREIAAAAGNEAVGDIIAGVEHLVVTGVADPERLAITGHSHGALLGPMVMARARRFRAASFAEGVANSVVMYELMSGNANREIHDVVIGSSLYDDPGRYLAESPDLHLRGVTTAALFEGGAYTAALYMLGFPKAAERFGMPSEFIVYPQTGHNIALPTLRREAANRNSDWLEFWMRGREDTDPAKADQYGRWRALASRSGHR